MKNKNNAFEKPARAPEREERSRRLRRPSESFDVDDMPAGFGDEELSRSSQTEHDEGQAPDDTLGLYLRQMGSIPLLTRKQELELAEKLERARKRFRHAVLLNWKVAAAVTDMYDRILADELAIDPCIDVDRLNLSRDKSCACPATCAPCIRPRKATSSFALSPFQLTPQGMAHAATPAFASSQDAKLAEELSPRVELLEALPKKFASWPHKCCKSGVLRKPRAVRGPTAKNGPSAKELRSDAADAFRPAYDRRVERSTFRNAAPCRANLRLVVSIAKRYRGAAWPSPT